MEPVLQTRNLNKKFGGVAALYNVNLTIQPNEVRCVIGPNGAGKSTLFNALCGLVKPDSGTIVFNGDDITKVTPSERVRRGFGLTFQTIRAYGQLTVRENLEIAYGTRLSGPGNALVDEIAGHFDFDTTRTIKVAELPHHELQWLEILMVLGTGATVGLFDEPTAGLAEKETRITAEAIKLCQKHGLTILVVEHDLKFIQQIAENVTVMHQGEIFFEGPLRSVLDNDDVKNIYLGRQG